jgi:hypothetical protein
MAVQEQVVSFMPTQRMNQEASVNIGRSFKSTVNRRFSLIRKWVRTPLL